MKCKHKGGSPCHLIDWFEKNPDKCPECVIEKQAEQIAELENRIEALTEDLGDADVENKRLKQHIKKICPDCEVRANRFVCHKDAGFDGVNSFCPDYCKAARRRKRVNDGR